MTYIPKVAPILQHAAQSVKSLIGFFRSRYCDYKALAFVRDCDYILETETGETHMGKGYEIFKARSAKQAPIVVFDLDGTVIDSTHRHLSNPDGSVDLVHWRENCTAEKIFADKLLPLARSMRAMHKAGHHVVICTARVMSQHDIDFLANNNLPYHGLLSRVEGDRRADADMKVCLLNAYLVAKGYSSIREANCIMFDDNLKVLDAMRKQGVICINATNENARQVA